MKSKKKSNSSNRQVSKPRQLAKKPISKKVSKPYKSRKKSEMHKSSKLSDIESEMPNKQKISKPQESPKGIASPKKQKKTKITVSTENPIPKINARKHMNLEKMLNERIRFNRKHNNFNNHAFSSNKYCSAPHIIYLLIYPEFYLHDHDN
jgi:hypothetical protein